MASRSDSRLERMRLFINGWIEEIEIEELNIDTACKAAADSFTLFSKILINLVLFSIIFGVVNNFLGLLCQLTIVAAVLASYSYAGYIVSRQNPGKNQDALLAGVLVAFFFVAIIFLFSLRFGFLTPQIFLLLVALTISGAIFGFIGSVLASSKWFHSIETKEGFLGLPKFKTMDLILSSAAASAKIFCMLFVLVISANLVFNLGTGMLPFLDLVPLLTNDFLLLAIPVFPFFSGYLALKNTRSNPVVGAISGLLLGFLIGVATIVPSSMLSLSEFAKFFINPVAFVFCGILFGYLGAIYAEWKLG